MEVEWGEQKGHINVAKHGVDFIAAAKVFDGPILEVKDRRRIAERWDAWLWEK
jgi:uncharacterized DUF497 family protein